MKYLKIIIIVLFAQAGLAQVNFIGVTEFTIAGQHYKVDYQTPYYLFVKNVNNNIENTPIQADCEYYNPLINPINVDNYAFIVGIIKNSLSPERKAALEANREYINLHLKYDNSYRIKEISFDLCLHTILTRQEIHDFEILLKDKFIIRHTLNNCNFNWLYLDITVSFR